MSGPKLRQNGATARTTVPKRTRAQIAEQARGLDQVIAKAAAAAVDDKQNAPAPESEGTVGELWLYGVVGGWWRGFDAESVAKAIAGMNVDTLYVRIHSPGGLARDGIAIANLFRNLKAKVVTVIDGLAASAASVIAIAGDEVVMCPGSQLMLHDASTGAWGNAAELRQLADWIDGQSQNYAGVYAYKAGGTAAEWRTVMTQNGYMGTWYTAEESVTAKLADRVGTIVAIGSPPVAPEDDWNDDDEEMLARAAHDLQILEQCVHPAARAAWRGEPIKPPTASAGGSITTQEGSSLVTRISDAAATIIGQKLGIAEDADEATILAALDEALDERTEPEPGAASIPEGHVVVPKAKLDDLEAGAAAGTAAAKKLHDQEREAFLDANKAKMSASNRDAWAKEYDRNPEGTREHFATAPDLVPVSEHGHSVDSDDATSADKDTVAAVTESEAYKNWEK